MTKDESCWRPKRCRDNERTFGKSQPGIGLEADVGALLDGGRRGDEAATGGVDGAVQPPIEQKDAQRPKPYQSCLNPKP